MGNKTAFRSLHVRDSVKRTLTAVSFISHQRSSSEKNLLFGLPLGLRILSVETEERMKPMHRK